MIIENNKITIIIDYNKENEKLINSLLHNDNSKIIISQNLDRNIFQVLTKLGMPSNLQGHKYLKEAIKLCFENDEGYLHPNLKLYPILSKIFNAKNYMIEKSIRDAITITWNKGNFDFQDKLFGYTIDCNKGKPTNSEFIAQIVNYLNTI